MLSCEKELSMKYLLILLLAVSVLSSCKDDEEPPIVEVPNPFLIKPGDAPLIVAHGGAKDLNPENTMLAFDYAVSANCDVLEMDIALTKDTVIVTIHDLTIDATSDGTGNVIDYTFDELQQFNFGYDFKALDGTYPYRNAQVKIPSLEALFTKYPNEYMIIEIKDGGANGLLAAEQLVALIREHDMVKKVVAFSFSNEVMDHFHSINADSVLTGAALGDGFAFVGAAQTNPDTILPLRYDVCAFPASMLGLNLDSDTIINAAHRNNVAMHYWTINDKQQMKDLIQKGVDGIITDRPDLMKEALAELGF